MRPNLRVVGGDPVDYKQNERAKSPARSRLMGGPMGVETLGC